LFSASYIIVVIKSRIVRWAGHVALMGKTRTIHSVLVRKDRRDHLGAMSFDVRITLK
jgi:hypothetical protein